MPVDVSFVSDPAQAPVDAVAVLAYEGRELDGAAARRDGQVGGAMSRALAAGRFKGARGAHLELLAPAFEGLGRLLLVGAGASDSFDAAAAEQVAASAFAAVRASGASSLTLDFDGPPEIAAHAAVGVLLAAYRFDRYRTREKEEAKTSVARVVVISADPAAAEAAFAPLRAVAEGVMFARDLVSEPPNVLFPEVFADRVKALEPMGLQVEVLDEGEMERLGMGSLLAVGRGSARASRLAVIQWRGAEDPDSRPVAFVGKGVTFDTGGISLKSADGMEDMKWDMGGAGAVAGLMHALAGRKAKVNAVGILGLVENMPDGAAMRPGDVVTSMSGQTIEIINTDAEGRLVLADALWYCQDRFDPRFMVDLATLTGAIITALGHDFAGLFSNDDELSARLLEAGVSSGEALWRMPLPASYEKLLDSPIADMKNIGGRPAGSTTAALFLQRFVNKRPWAHLDIAAVAWRAPSTRPTTPDGATGFGVRLLDRLVADHYEG